MAQALLPSDPPGAAGDPLAPSIAPGAGSTLATAPGTGPPAPGARLPGARLPALVPRFALAAYALEAALALERELGVGHVLAQVLVRRGLHAPEQARAFLDAGIAHDPSGFTDLDTALALIREQLAAGRRIVVHGDYDVDGVCATAILVRALRALGADVGWFLPSRIEDGYGLSTATVERLAARGTALIVTVDCAVTAVEAVQAAHAAGVQVVVTDHHAPRPDGVLPDCPIVHPALCDYPFGGLCGAGVAHKLAQALRAPTAAEDLDLVALATVADLVPLLDENRRLVREGLVALANTAKPGLRALIRVSRADPSALDTGTLGFRLAPRINAAGRLRRADAALELLLTEDRDRAREIAEELDALNGERRAVEQRILWEAERQVAALGPRPAYVLASEEWHPGVIGIVASRVVERYHRPAVLIALDGAAGSGSGRSIPGFDLLAALTASSEHLGRYGGHRAAAGLTIAAERIEAFRDTFEAHAASALTPEMLEREERIDAIASGADLGLALAEELARLEPCGMGNPAPRLLVPGARFADVRPMGEGRHARFAVCSGGARAGAVAFGCDGRLAGDPGQPRDATFRLERNVWNGAVEPRLVLRHERPCAPDAIAVLGEPDDYLAAVLAELDADLGVDRDRDLAAVRDAPPPPSVGAAGRTVLDRRGLSALAVLGDAVAAGGPVIAVTASVPRRLHGLRARAGGFTLIGYDALETSPELAAHATHLIALDPPSSARRAALLTAGTGYTAWAWGAAELRFAEQMHELEYGLRTALVALYRGLRARGQAAGEELERLLRGDGPHDRPARLAGRLIRVLAELELVSLDRDLPALAIAGAAPTKLERSPSYRAYAKRYEDGQRFLSSARLPASA